MRKLWLLILIILLAGCVGESGINDPKEAIKFSEQAENQTGDYKEQLDEEPEEEKEIGEEIAEVEPELNETGAEYALNTTDGGGIVEEIEEAIENQTEKEIIKQKHFTWNATFEIYNISKTGTDRFLSDEIFEIEKDKILSLIIETEYVNYTPIYPAGFNLSSGFSIEVTQEGYDIIQKKISGKSISKYLSKISLYIIIDPEILVDEKILCEKDEDCIAVDAGCCGCTAGGGETSINRKYREYWKDKLSEGCKEIGCPGAMSDHISCFSEPKCINNTCEVIPSKERVCNSNLYYYCSKVPELRHEVMGMGISCMEVVEFCE